MINILPDNLKEERRYGRLNVFMVKQVFGIAIVGALAIGFMLSGLQLVKNDEQVLVDAISDKETEYQKLAIYEAEAKEINQKIKAIEGLYQKEVKFSELLQDIASALPLNTRLKSLSLSDTPTEPLQIVAEADTQELAAVLQKSLVDSEIFEKADIISIVPGETSDTGVILNYDVTIDAEFTGTADARAAEKARQEAEAAAAREAATTQTEVAE